MATEFVTYDATKVDFTIDTTKVEDIAPQAIGGTTGIIPFPGDLGGDIYVTLQGVPVARSPPKSSANTRGMGAVSIYSGSRSADRMLDIARGTDTTRNGKHTVEIAALGAGLGFKSITLENVQFSLPTIVMSDDAPIYTFSFTGWNYNFNDAEA